MINSCFTKKIKATVTGVDEYPFGVKILLPTINYNKLTIYCINGNGVNAKVRSNFIFSNNNWTFNTTGNSVEISDMSGTGTGKDYVIIKDVRNLIIFLLTEYYYFARYATLNTRFYKNVDYNLFDSMPSYIEMAGTNIEGEITDFCGLTLVNDFRFATTSSYTQTSKISGTLESFAEGLIANGKTSGSITITCNGVITYNGSIVPAQTVRTITFNGSSYTVE